MDPLSDLLSLMRPHAYVSSGFDAGGAWAVRFGDQHRLIKCYAVVSGNGWLAIDGIADPVRLEGGDCFVLPSGRSFRLGNAPDGAALAASEVFPRQSRGERVTLNGGGDFFLVGSRFGVSGANADWLLRRLPPMIHIRDDAAQTLRWSVERMMAELRAGAPGDGLMLQHLAHLMLIEALRISLTQSGTDHPGWFAALGDRQLGAALRAIHAEPARAWTLEALGRIAGMSRSTFALQFKARIGETPMRYVTRWRMLLACNELEHSTDPVSLIALRSGYESESAFSTAFRRLMGRSPRAYRRASMDVLSSIRAAAGI